MVTRASVIVLCGALAISLSLVQGCSTPKRPSVAERGVTKRQAVAIARAELARRGLEEPAGASIEVEDGFATNSSGLLVLLARHMP